MIRLKHPLILASGSPRRKELLEKLGFSFTVKTVDVEEHIPTEISPTASAQYLANLKGEAHDFLAKHHIIITADTIVIANGKVMSKPISSEDAILMLQKLSGKSHEVITGVSIRCNNEVHSFEVSTQVTFKKLSHAEIEFYVKSNHATDKAGAYGIQDWIGLIGISTIKGSYYNVMGLPTVEVYDYLKNYFSI